MPSAPSFASDDGPVARVTTKPAIATAGAALNRPANRFGLTASLRTANASTSKPPAAARTGMVSQSLIAMPCPYLATPPANFRASHVPTRVGAIGDTVRRAVTTHSTTIVKDDQARSQSRYPPHSGRDRGRGPTAVRRRGV